MKVEEKMKKNKNYEISHIVRPEVTPEVYKQKQNTLFIFGCVKNRRFKVTWARLWVYARLSACVGRMPGSAVQDARLGWARGSAVHTIECMC
mgnify:CR=1 FL=1